jgi:hypothetical protein
VPVKIRILAVVVVTVLLALSCRRSALEPRAEARPAAPSQERPITGSPGSESLKELVFADDPLEKVVDLYKGQTLPGDIPFRRFASARSRVRQGHVKEAKEDLRQLLTDPETRIRLWAWRALRDLGEKPDPNTVDQVQGVVCELSNEAGVGTVAAYEDGRARWLGGQGAVTVWEAPGSNPEIDKAIRDLLKAAAPLVKSVPVSAQHRSSRLEKDHFRVSVLTYGGVHVAEAFGPSIDEAHTLAPPLLTSGPLIQALQAVQDSKKN